MKRRKLLPKATNKANNNSVIVLFAKKPGRTSFSSLYTIKKALKTTKVGHTGTLDSFASGLLVVCAGSLTRLAGRITEFDKTYKAVIKFGEETDTLECTGKVVKTAPLPAFSDLEKAFEKWSGKIMQVPPAFSALHLNGSRASDLARSGKAVELAARPVEVFSYKIIDTLFDDVEKKKVRACLAEFSVSKGTYIRALARDIAYSCGSAGHLTGLLRTRVGNFRLEDAAGFSELEDFSVKSVMDAVPETAEKQEQEERLIQECIEKSLPMTKELALQCGFACAYLLPGAEKLFENGAKLNPKMFSEDIRYAKRTSSLVAGATVYPIVDTVPGDSVDLQFAVFDSKGIFCGILNCANGKLSYGYVVPKASKV